MNPLLARLRFAAANLQVLPLIALLLVVIAALAQLLLLPSREAAIAEAEHRLVQLERGVRRAMSERNSALVTPTETRQHLLEHFPTEGQLNAELGRLIEMANQQELRVPGGDYRLMPGKDGLLVRYVLNLPVKGSYGAIRSYLRAVRSEFPDLAVDDIALHRENIGSSEIEAQLRFVIFGRSRTP